MKAIEFLKFIVTPQNKGEEAVAAACLFLLGMMILLH
jgi:hypothetical protein